MSATSGNLKGMGERCCGRSGRGRGGGNRTEESSTGVLPFRQSVIALRGVVRSEAKRV